MSISFFPSVNTTIYLAPARDYAKQWSPKGE